MSEKGLLPALALHLKRIVKAVGKSPYLFDLTIIFQYRLCSKWLSKIKFLILSTDFGFCVSPNKGKTDVGAVVLRQSKKQPSDPKKGCSVVCFTVQAGILREYVATISVYVDIAECTRARSRNNSPIPKRTSGKCNRKFVLPTGRKVICTWRNIV